MSLQSMKLNRTIQIDLASGSGFFLEGIRNVLREVDSVKIVYEASNAKEIEKCLVEMRPDCLFLDNRAINMSIRRLLSLITKKSPGIRVVLFGNNVKDIHELLRQSSGKAQSNDENKSSNIICLTKETNSSQLIELIRNSSKSNLAKETAHEHYKNGRLTIMEAKVAELIIRGFRNKEIAKKLSITDGTVKSHLTSIFMKLGLQSRYQLMVYGKRLRQQSI